MTRTDSAAQAGVKTQHDNKSFVALQWIALGLFVVSFSVISYFHEPWLDEAQAWQIARCASIKDILFYIPHYEGHPSLWYLILAIPARMGLPYELSLSAVSGLAACISAWLIIFKSPFPKPLKLLLPFQYFFFYQYGVVSRPYTYSVLCFLLMAITFEKKDEKPWRFMLPMLILCATSGYGIVLAGGISIAWVLNLFQEKKWQFLKISFWLDKRIVALAVLLVGALGMIWQIMPMTDTYATNQSGTNSIFVRMLYTFFAMLPDASAVTIMPGSTYLDRVYLAPYMLAAGIAVGCIYLLIILALSSKKNIIYFALPYAFFAVFSACVYFCAHHMGLVVAFTVFWFWIALKDENKWEIGKGISTGLKIKAEDQKLLRKLQIVFWALVMGVSIFWTVGASYLDVRYPYYYGRDMAIFLKDTGLAEAKIMSIFDESNPAEGEIKTAENAHTEIVSRPLSILPYFEHNIIENLGMGSDAKAYVIHRVKSTEETQKDLDAWKSMGYPEVVIGPMDLELVFRGDAEEISYYPIYEYGPFLNIWKSFLSGYNIEYKEHIYLREDLLDKYGMEPLK